MTAGARPDPLTTFNNFRVCLLYARVGGHLYEQAIAGFAFEPLLDPVPLNKGERTAGWAMFDVPTRHGQLVLRDLDEKTVAVWKY